MSSVFASGADARYGYHLLNLLGSLKTNSDIFDRIVVFDLGLTSHQRELLDGVRDVEVRSVPSFVPHWRQGFTWKPWIWTHLDAGDQVFWLDAGDTVLRPLDRVLSAVRDHGYFLVSQGRPLREIVPSDYYEPYGLSPRDAEREYVAAGIVGFSPTGEFHRRVIVPTYNDCLAGRSLGFSAAELHILNRGLNGLADPPVRDCEHFRWDQTVFNLRLFTTYEEPIIHELDEYGGHRSRFDHPQQVIWNHRQRGNMAYLWRVPYLPGRRLRGRLFGIGYRLRWWRKLNERLFMSSTYVWKAKKLMRPLARSQQ